MLWIRRACLGCRRGHQYRLIYREPVAGGHAPGNSILPGLVDVQEDSKRMLAGYSDHDHDQSQKDILKFPKESCLVDYERGALLPSLLHVSATLGGTNDYQVAAHDECNQFPHTIRKSPKESCIVDHERGAVLPSLLHVSATLGGTKYYQVAAHEECDQFPHHEECDQFPQAIRKSPKVSGVAEHERAARLRLFQPRYQRMSWLLHRERRACLLSQLQPGVRTMSRYQNVQDEDDCLEQQLKQDDRAETQMQEDESSEQPWIHKVQNTNDTKPPFRVEIGDAEELRRRITSELENMEIRVLNFQNRYNKSIRPMLASRCLILPHNLKHPSTLFLHRQTFKIVNHNPTYLSSCDVMCYEDGVKDEKEWQLFLHYLVMKRTYIDEDWDSTISTVETLMYDHGLKGPYDDRELFHKGECDASFGRGNARLSFIIWKGDKIIYSAVYTNVVCSSSTEAEVFAAFALLSKAKEMNILNLLVCCDCKPICSILSGEMKIGMSHDHWNLYLMLRSMKRLFDKLIAMWKPRELMVFADDLAKATDNAISSPMFPVHALQRWSHHLMGQPLFRIERTPDTKKIIAKFAKRQVDESCGTNHDFIYFVEVDEDRKLDCLLGLKQSLNPSKLVVSLSNINGKSMCFIREFEKVINMLSKKTFGQYSTFTDTRENVSDLVLVVIFDPSMPKEAYYHSGAFHVILLTAAERKNLSGQEIAELNALFFVYFNGVRLPLNEPSADSSADLNIPKEINGGKLKEDEKDVDEDPRDEAK